MRALRTRAAFGLPRPPSGSLAAPPNLGGGGEVYGLAINPEKASLTDFLSIPKNVLGVPKQLLGIRKHLLGTRKHFASFRKHLHEYS